MKLGIIFILIIQSSVMASLLLEKNRTISVLPGTVTSIYLSENPSTGYVWSALVEGSKTISVSKSIYKASDVPNMAGAPGFRYFFINAKRAKSGDSANASFILKRSFEDSSVQTLAINILVKSQKGKKLRQ